MNECCVAILRELSEDCLYELKDINTVQSSRFIKCKECKKKLRVNFEIVEEESE